VHASRTSEDTSKASMAASKASAGDSKAFRVSSFDFSKILEGREKSY